MKFSLSLILVAVSASLVVSFNEDFATHDVPPTNAQIGILERMFPYTFGHIGQNNKAKKTIKTQLKKTKNECLSLTSRIFEAQKYAEEYKAKSKQLGKSIAIEKLNPAPSLLQRFKNYVGISKVDSLTRQKKNADKKFRYYTALKKQLEDHQESLQDECDDLEEDIKELERQAPDAQFRYEDVLARRIPFMRREERKQLYEVREIADKARLEALKEERAALKEALKQIDNTKTVEKILKIASDLEENIHKAEVRVQLHKMEQEKEKKRKTNKLLTLRNH